MATRWGWPVGADRGHVEDPLLLEVGGDLGVGHRDLLATAGHGRPRRVAYMIPVRSSSGAISHSAAHGRRPGIRPSGPTTWATSDIGSDLDLARPRVDGLLGDALDDRREHRRRQPPTAAGHAPHRRRRRAPAAAASTAEPVGRDAGRARRAPRPRRARGRRRRRRSPPPRSGTSSLSMSSRSSRCTNDEAWWPASTASTRTSPRRASAIADEVGPPDRRHGRPVGQRGDEPVDRWRRRSISSTALRGRRRSGRSSSASGRTATTAARSSGGARRSAGRRRRARPCRGRARAGPRRSPARATRHRHPGPGPRTAGARSGARPHGTDRRSRYRHGASTLGGRSEPACYRRTPWPRTHRRTSCWPRSVREARPLEEWLTTFHLARSSSTRTPTRARGSCPPRRASSRACAAPTPGSTSSSPPTSATPGASSARWSSEFLVFTDPGPRRRQGARPDRAAGVRVRPRRRHGAGRRRGLERGGVAGRRRGRSPTATAWRAPDIPVVGDPGPFHGSPGARLSPACRAALALPDLPIVEILDDLRGALAGAGPRRRRRPAGRRQDDRRPARPARRAVARRPPHRVLEPRRLATRAAARRMADLTGTDGRRPRRLPDPRRAPHRAGDPRSRSSPRAC